MGDRRSGIDGEHSRADAVTFCEWLVHAVAFRQPKFEQEGEIKRVTFGKSKFKSQPQCEFQC